MMLFTIILTTLLTTMKIVHTDGIKTTSPVLMILDGLTLQTWMNPLLRNKTQLSIVHHLNEICKKDSHCEADYGISNVHIIDTVQHGSTSIRLNITADEPVSSFNMKFNNVQTAYNYTALLTGALLRAKLDIEHLYGIGSFNTVVDRTNRLLFVLLGILLVALIFGLTVFFFQRIRRHSYSQLLKPVRSSPPTQDELLTNSPSMSAIHP